MKVKILTILTLAVALFLSACGGKSDADLQKAATDKLAAEKVTGVTVAVKDGVATLTGEVMDVTYKSKAEATVKGVEGIKSVTNNCTLKPVPSPTQPTDPKAADAMAKTTVEEALKKMNITGVTVAVNDGDVTLSGTIPKDKLPEAMKAAQEADVKHVTNKLVLK